AAHENHHLSYRAVSFDLAVSLGHLFEGEAMAHMRPQQSVVHQIPDRGENVSRALGLDLLPGGYGHELVVNAHVAVEKSLTPIGGVGSKDSDNLAVDSGAIQTLREYIAADGVEDHRDTAPIGKIPDALGEILGAIVDDLIGMQHVPTERNRLVASRGR